MDATLGAEEGKLLSVGAAEGRAVGAPLGRIDIDGRLEGVPVGPAVELTLGAQDGASAGVTEGWTDGA